MSDQLKAVLNSIVPFSDSEFELIRSLFSPVKVSRGQVLLRDSEICTEFYMVIKGCIRVYFMDQNGKEKTRYLMPDWYIGTALTSFISESPSFERIDALSNSELLVISRSDFYFLNETMPKWSVFYQKILEMAYSFQTRKIESLVTLSAQQRFEQVWKQSPVLFQLVSNKTLASYMDLTPETLSRLKSKNVRS